MEKIKDLMITDVECATLLDNVYEIAVKMKELDVGAIPIVDGDKLVGLVTDRDLVVRGIAEKRPGSTKISTVMTTDLITASPDMTASEAAELMAKHQIRRLPVVQGDKLVGIIALGDLATNKLTDNQAGEALSEISENEMDTFH